MVGRPKKLESRRPKHVSAHYPPLGKRTVARHENAPRTHGGRRGKRKRVVSWVRDRLVRRRTALINEIRGFLLERGITFAAQPRVHSTAQKPVVLGILQVLEMLARECESLGCPKTDVSGRQWRRHSKTLSHSSVRLIDCSASSKQCLRDAIFVFVGFPLPRSRIKSEKKEKKQAFRFVSVREFWLPIVVSQTRFH
jgi:hypothetical protein